MRFFKYTTLALCASLALASCSDDDDTNGGGMMPDPVDLTGTYVQEDIMGRPGITTVLGGSDMTKNEFNATLPTTRSEFADDFLGTVNAYYNAFGASYETNILGISDTLLTAVLATTDALQVAQDGPTTYFDPSTGVPLTGRNLTDDVVDVSLILLFGGNSGARFNGDNGTPELVSDNVGFGDREVLSDFPYLQGPLQ